MSKNKYNLVGVDGNAFAVMGYVTKAMRSEKLSQSEINDYLTDAKSSDYNHLLYVSICMVEKCNELHNKAA